jgi:hypothetical protein
LEQTLEGEESLEGERLQKTLQREAVDETLEGEDDYESIHPLVNGQVPYMRLRSAQVSM